ncbi:MAG: transcription-repair coupling factor, partial [Proteobacteria bacterium]|nr:transcription-repair coupling factor [Pseudomonadota bacterium]
MDALKKTVKRLDAAGGRVAIGGAPDGFDALLLAALAERGGKGRDVLFVARDDVSMARTSEALAFFAPGLERLEFPAWDCLPYDRVSPRPEIVSRRIDTLTRLLEPPGHGRGGGRMVLTTVSAFLQRVPPRKGFADAALAVTAGRHLDPARLIDFLSRHGYARSDTVMEPGEFAQRGGIVDVFPSGADNPLRLDFFGDEVEAIRVFEAAGQRTTGERESALLKPVSEVLLTEDAISRFRSGYRVLFGHAGDDDPLYAAVTAGHRHLGMEHWLPLFYEKLETLLDYAPRALVVLDHQATEARDARLAMIAEYFTTRQGFADAGPKTGLAMAGTVYHPVPPRTLTLDAEEWDALLANRAQAQLSPFVAPDAADAVDAGGRPGHDFADVRVTPGANVFEALKDHVRARQDSGRRVVISAYTEGSRERLLSVLGEHGLEGLVPVATWAEALALDPPSVALAVVGLERGFETPDLAVISEPDILGDRMSRPSRPRVRPENFIAEASALSPGDLVVHMDHGIGRFDGLQAIEVSGAPHDCLRLIYGGGDKLFLPVENIEVISRYGSEDAAGVLDRLGGAAWQARKARLKDRIRHMARDLIRVAADRELKTTARIVPAEGLYEEFSARFPYTETDDQALA